MKNSKNYLVGLLFSVALFACVLDIKAESPYKKVFYNAFINRETYKWGSLIRTEETTNPPATTEQKLELINYYYGFIGHMMGKKQYETAREFIERAEKLNNQVLKSSPKNATAFSYKGAFMGMRIGLNRIKSVYLWPESKGYIDKALKLEPNNVQAIIDKGNLLFYSPNMLGGDKEEALELFHKAEKIMEKNKDTDHNWEYLNLLVTMAKAYEKLDNLQEAKHYYEKALQKEPNFKWVKDDLYPKLLAIIK